MRKGISPLIASVLLIAITMAVAAILANYVSSFTKSTISNLPTCVGGSVSYVSADYPKWETSKQIVAVLESQNVPLGGFRFSVTLNNDTVLNYNDIQGQALPSGARGDVRTQISLPFEKTDVKNLVILTNCTNVRTEPTGLR